MMEIDHAGVVVKSREAAIEFYRDVLGLNVERQYERTGPEIDAVVGLEHAHLKSAMLSASNGFQLELIEYVFPAPIDDVTRARNAIAASHIAIRVTGIHELFSRLVAAGVFHLSPPVELTPGRLVCYLCDPDGNWIELIELTEADG